MPPPSPPPTTFPFAGTGTISGTDFATSLVTAADIKSVDGLLDKVWWGLMHAHCRVHTHNGGGDGGTALRLFAAESMPEIPTAQSQCCPLLLGVRMCLLRPHHPAFLPACLAHPAHASQAQSLPPQLAAARISLREFEDMAQLRRNMHLMSFALDFCTQVGQRRGGEGGMHILSQPALPPLLLLSSPPSPQRRPQQHFHPLLLCRTRMSLVACAPRPSAVLGAQIQRPLSKPDFAKLLQKSLGVSLSQPVLDIVFAVFGDASGLLDGAALVQVMKARNRVPGYRVRQSHTAAPAGGVRCCTRRPARQFHPATASNSHTIVLLPPRMP